MSQVKRKLTDDFNNFLGLMLAAHWQLASQKFEGNSNNSRFFKVYISLSHHSFPEIERYIYT